MNAQPDQTAFMIGVLIGALVVGVVCGLLPLCVGISKKRPVLGGVGFVACIGGGLVLGLLLAAPLALVFTVIIAVMGPPQTADAFARDRRRVDEYDDREKEDDYDRDGGFGKKSEGIQRDDRGGYQ